MPDETAPTEGGEMVPPITDYESEPVEPEPRPEPSTPESTDGTSIVDGPYYPAPGEDVG